MQLVFVYGSLQTGLHNHHLLRSARLIANKIYTVERFALIGTPDGYPYALHKENARPIDTLSNLIGELYDVDANTLDKLDELEEHPVWYRRREIAVTLNCQISHGRVCSKFASAATGSVERHSELAWMYILNEPDELSHVAADGAGEVYKPVADGDWRGFFFSDKNGRVEVATSGRGVAARE